jgi:hypothetical protein
MSIWTKLKTDKEYEIENLVMSDSNKVDQVLLEKTQKLINHVITSETYGYFTNIKTLFLIAAIMPLISSDAERMFSLSSLIHSAIRNSLKIEHVKKLIVVHLYTSDISNFDAEKILHWYVVTKKHTDIYDKINKNTAVFKEFKN